MTSRDALLVAAGVAFVCCANLWTYVDWDLGWMLAYARDAVATGALPRTNTWTFAEPGHPVVMHGWASLLALYAAHAALGGAGVVVARLLGCALVVVGTAWAVFRATPRADARFVALLACLAAAPQAFDFARAQLFTQALLPVVGAIGLYGSRRALWSTVPILWLWPNLHGGYVAGLGVVAACCAARLVERPRTVPARELIAIPLACAVVTVANPYGVGMARMALATIRGGGQDRVVAEWMPVWAFGAPTDAATLLLGALVVVVAAGLRRGDLRGAVLLVVTVALAASAVRHTRIASAMLAPLVAASLDRLLARAAPDAPRFERVVGAAAVALVAACVAVVASTGGAALRLRDLPRPSPATAIAVLELNDLHGDVWNDYAWGGPLAWASPRSRLLIDPRAWSAYSPAHVAASVRVEDPGEAYAISGATLALVPAAALPSFAAFATPLYCDDGACLLSRDPRHVERLQAGLLVPTAPLTTSDLFAAPGPPDLRALVAASPR